jgi:hypothetical protein
LTICTVPSMRRMVNQPALAGHGLNPVASGHPIGCSGANQTVVEPSAAASAAGDG